jgi:1,4-alpha-glucan branching enzyme
MAVNGKKRVTFTLAAPEAESVELLGTFNDWGALPMKADGKGGWKAIVMLAPGTYEYRLKVDGAWMSDPTAPYVPNEHGTTNSVREVAAA